MRRMKKKYKPSIMPEDNPYCRLCGSPYTEVHHVFGGPYRSKATEDGLVTHFCHDHHQRLHNDAAWSGYVRELKKTGQIAWMEHYGKDEKEFIKRYGKSRLYEKDTDQIDDHCGLTASDRTGEH